MSSERHTHSVAKLIEDNLLTIGDGYRAKNVELASTGIPFARVGNIDGGFNFAEADLFPLDGLNKVGDKVSRPGDVVLTSKGTVGRFAFVREGTPQFVYSPQLSYWRSLDFNTIDPRFLFYWIQGEEFSEQADGVKSQTDMADYVSLTDQRRMKITLLPVEDQRTIARVLGALDDKIELNRRMNHTLEEMARALFKSWFVDFDPVTAKAEGRVPFGMNAETLALFSAEFEETEEASIPKGWKVGTLKQIAEVNSDSVKNDYPHKEIKYIDISSVESGHLIGMTNMEIQNAPSRARRLVKHGDTIWSCVRPNRKSYLFIQHPAANVVVSTGFAVLSPKIPSTSFVYLWVTTNDFVDYLTANAEGSAYPAVRPESFERASVVIPPDDVLIAFEKIVISFFELRNQNATQMHNLVSIRDALLPKLLSGELRVKQAEKVIQNM